MTPEHSIGHLMDRLGAHIATWDLLLLEDLMARLPDSWSDEEKREYVEARNS